MSNNDIKLVFLSKWKEKVSRNLTDIESRDDLSVDEKSNRIIHIFSAACAGMAVQPIPFADALILTPMQAYMAERLAAVRGVPIDKGTATECITVLAKVIGLGLLAQQFALGAYKVGLPGLAGFTTIPLVYGLTYAIGKVLDYQFIERSKGKKLSPDEIRKKWSQFKKEGRAKGKEYKKKAKAEGLSND